MGMVLLLLLLFEGRGRWTPRSFSNLEKRLTLGLQSGRVGSCELDGETIVFVSWKRTDILTCQLI